jgi:hypothetical protein
MLVVSGSGLASWVVSPLAEWLVPFFRALMPSIMRWQNSGGGGLPAERERGAPKCGKPKEANTWEEEIPAEEIYGVEPRERQGGPGVHSLGYLRLFGKHPGFYSF